VIMDPQECSCCHRVLVCPLSIGVLVFCPDCRPADVDECHEALITGPWPPAILIAGWTCPHQGRSTAPPDLP
jgi:hypothetical protein